MVYSISPITLALDALLIEMQNKANSQVDELLNRLLLRVLYPLTTNDSTGCPKHTHALQIYREISCLRTKYRRLWNLIPGSQAEQVECRYVEARDAFELASCSCISKI